MKALARFKAMPQIAALVLVVAGLSFVMVGTAPMSAAAATHNVLITGDSITQGSNGDYTWRYRLDKKLQQTAPGQYSLVGPDTKLFDHLTNSYTSTNYADQNFTGKRHAARWGSSFLAELPLIRGQVADYNATTLVVMLGSNDMSFNTSPEGTVENLQRFIGEARAARPGIDVVIGEVVTKYDPWSQSVQLQSQANEYASRVRTLASQMNTASSRVVVAPTLQGWNPVLHTWDGTHPNAAGETLIAQRVSEALASIGLGTASPNVYDANARWSVRAPAPTVQPGTERATVSWSLQSTGSTSMYMSYHLDKPNQQWSHLPYPVGSTEGNRWTITPLAGGASYDFALIANKGFMSSDLFSPIVSKDIPGITPGQPTNLSVRAEPDSPTNGTQLRLSWNSGSNATAYLLAMKRFPGDHAYTELPYPLIDVTAWNFGLLEPGRYYKLRVRSARGFLNSNWATSSAARTKGIPAYPNYAVLGDSYAAGNGLYEGIFSNQKPPPWYEDTCYRASASWSSLVLPYHMPRRKIFACSGSQLPQILGGANADQPAGAGHQANAGESFFAQQPDRAQLITVSIGGNDVGFADVLSDCFVWNCAQGSKPQLLEWSIDDLEASLTAMYTNLRNKFKYADIVAMGYPAPISLASTSLPCSATITETERLLVLLATKRLNRVIDSAASSSDVWGGIGLDLVDAFSGRSACSNNALIHDFQVPLPIAFHQNAQGHYKYGEVMNVYLNRKMS